MDRPPTNTKAKPSGPKAGVPSTSRRGKYAKARIAKGLTYDRLRELTGLSFATIAAADKGLLPKHKAIRAAYLNALGLSEASEVKAEPAAAGEAGAP